MIYVFTGNGGGKTIAALGLALRSLGHGHRVVIVQFMKGRKDIGEFKLQKHLKNLKFFQFGRRGFIDLKHPQKIDLKLAKKGFEFARKAAKKYKPHLLILDEINLATSSGLLNIKDVLKFLKKLPKGIDIVLTGRRAPKEFIRLADGVSEIRKIKHVFDLGIKAKKGIEY